MAEDFLQCDDTRVATSTPQLATIDSNSLTGYPGNVHCAFKISGSSGSTGHLIQIAVQTWTISTARIAFGKS